ncbi:MAG: Gfo/Idh/MocA family oxidoreductase [Alphaproteobacteria bacterium]|nr:Gfo/Idh/MocA family oxidoreductase [Alphaproteobacteria bacterium]
MKKIRYAVVGSGWISQIAFMPSVEQTGNSEMTAIVTGNRAGAEKLAKFYGIEHIFSYEQYDDMLRQGIVDAVYIALPNSMHADYSIRAANAGVHALVEKPLAVSVAECEAMIAAADKAGVWLMTAYRLHNEPGTIDVIDRIRKGEIGDPRFFSSLFSFQVAAGNHRLKAEHWGGPLQDIGVYCLNAVRHAFGCEPTEAMAMKSHGDNDPRFTEVEGTISTLLRFPGDRIAHFTASFGGQDMDMYRIIGSDGDIEVQPGFRFENTMKIRMNQKGKITEKTYPKTDHFSGMTAYFSDCILKGIRPEPDGGDGLNDVRALLAIEKAAMTGLPQKIESAPRPSHPTPDMVRLFPDTDKRLML